MKKLTILLAICTGLILASCGGGKVGNSPEDVTKAFFAHIQKMDFKGAKKYATSESGSMLDMMEMSMGMAKNMGKNMGKDAEMEKMKDAKVEIGTAKINGDEATIAVTTDGKAKDIRLKKENGAWKVAFDKTSMAKEGMNEMDKPDNAGDTLNNRTESLDDAARNMGNVGDSLKMLMEKLNDPKVKESLEKLKEASEKLKDLQ